MSPSIGKTCPFPPCEKRNKKCVLFRCCKTYNVMNGKPFFYNGLSARKKVSFCGGLLYFPLPAPLLPLNILSSVPLSLVSGCGGGENMFASAVPHPQRSLLDEGCCCCEDGDDSLQASRFTRGIDLPEQPAFSFLELKTNLKSSTSAL